MVYILRITPPLEHAKFYIGYCEDDSLDHRLHCHQHGTGAAITRAVIRSGRELSLVAVLPRASRTTERLLKNRKNTPKLVASILRNPKDWIIR